MPSDDFPGQNSVISPSERFPTITPNDDTDLAEIPKFVTVGQTAGTVRCKDKHGNISTFYVVAGGFLPVRPVRIYATTTTATPIIACY